MDKFDDKYEVDMMNNEHKKMMTFILTSQQLKRSFCKEFICFLEQQLFYHAWSCFNFHFHIQLHLLYAQYPLVLFLCFTTWRINY